MAERGTNKTIPGIDIQLWKPTMNDMKTQGVPIRQFDDGKDPFLFEKCVDEVSVDFLSLLFQHVKTRMAVKGYDDRDIVHMACTVPAMWSRTANKRTLDAVLEAGRGSNFAFCEDISIWSEPEAATAYVMTCIENIEWAVSKSLTLTFPKERLTDFCGT